MEDILASIRRIIAADHSIPGARNGLGPLPLRSPARSSSSPPQPDRAEQNVQSQPEGLAAAPSASVEELTVASVGAADANADAAHLPASFDTRYRDHVESVESEAPPAELEFEPETQAAGIYDLRPHDLVAGPEKADALLSPSVGASISSSFQALAESVLFHDPETLERMAEDALRPMLKTWLDENLPSMVERLVRAEIERVARGSRSRT